MFAERSPAASRLASVLDAATIALLPLATIYLGLNAGGYFADDTGWVAVALALALALRFAVSGGPFANGGWAAWVAAGSLAGFALWTLASAIWFDRVARTLFEFDRTLLYLLAFLLFASIERPRAAWRWLPVGFAAAAAFLCAAGLATRTVPDLWPYGPGAAGDALAYPVTYSNGLGILAVLGALACLHLASWERERVPIRVLGVMALPMFAATLSLTSSTGAVVAGGIGAVVYVVAGRPSGLLTAVLAAAPFVLLAVDAAQGAELLQRADPVTAPAREQGEDLARTVGLAMLGSAVLFGLFLLAERWVLRMEVPRPSRTATIIALAVLGVGVVGAGAVLLPDAVGSLDDELDGLTFSRGDLLAAERAGRTPVAEAQPRIDYWRIALDLFDEHPVTGGGVGSFAERWALDRPVYGAATEGHSLYLETLGELGVIGAALLLVTLATMLWAFGSRARGPDRALGAVALGMALAWMTHAALEWDWELPALTMWMFAFGGCAAASVAAEGSRRQISPALRAVGAAVLVAAALTPAVVALSQQRVNAAAAALTRGDCEEAERLAAGASNLLPPRAEPYELIAYCASRAGDHERAEAMMQRALEREPDSWRLHYGLALVRGAAKVDPRPAIRRAHDLNRFELILIQADKRFAGTDPQRWRRQALGLPLPLR